MSDANLVFLPWVRRGAAAALLKPGTAASAGTFAVQASVTVNNGPSATRDVTLIGPGHVTGLDRRQVVRTDPTPGSRAFESNYFPLVDLDEPSLPWLFTPAGADTQERLRPWLVLVVVPVGRGVRLSPPTAGTLPILHVDDPIAELPDLEDSWAWAHAQVTSDPSVSVDAQFAGNPERTVARLVCPRVMKPETEYLACVVPAFELGRMAGLGEKIEEVHETHLLPAWPLPPQPLNRSEPMPIDLPVYYSWTFTTAPVGDFESLAMLLRARPLPEGIGEQAIDVGASGLKRPGLTGDPESVLPAGTALTFGGALRPANPRPAGWPSSELRMAWDDALRPVLNASAQVTAGHDPMLAPPLYGGTQAGFAVLDSSKPSRWFEQLNLLPSHRAVANLGTRVVQDQQEALMSSAWDQAADLRKVNQQLRQTQLGWRVSTRFHDQLARMDAGVGLQVIALANDRLVRINPALKERLALAGVDLGSSDVAIRRVARPRGTVNRRLQRVSTSAVPRTVSMLGRFRPERLDEVLDERLDEHLEVFPPGPVSLERVASGVVDGVTWAKATPDAVAEAPQRPFFAFVPMGQPVPISARAGGGGGGGGGGGSRLPDRPDIRDRLGVGDVVVARESRARFPIGRGGPIGGDPPVVDPPVVDPHPDPPRPVDSAAAAAFRELARVHLETFRPERPAPEIRHGNILTGEERVVLRLQALTDAWGEALVRTAPTTTFAARVRAVVTIPDQGESGEPVPDEIVLSELGLTPAFPQPMVEALGEIAQSLIVPGLDLVPPNTIVPLETNTAFVEAYLAGLNTEMGRELLWRGYPARLDATYFDRFWDARSAPERPPDIVPIAEWAERSIGAATTTEQFVMLVRSDLLQRYPDAIVYATKDGTDRHPIFTGGFAPDIRYFGFEIPIDEAKHWSIVIQEHPSAPRFGVEVRDVPVGASHIPPPEANAALVAAKTRQLPVRITIPTKAMGLT